MREMEWKIQTTFVFQYHTRDQFYSIPIGAPYFFVIHHRIACGHIPAITLGLN
jgi:hypothetical protein